MQLRIEAGERSPDEVRARLEQAGWRRDGDAMRRGGRLWSRMLGVNTGSPKRWPTIAEIRSIEGSTSIEVMDDVGAVAPSTVPPRGPDGRPDASQMSTLMRGLSGVSAWQRAETQVREEIEAALGDDV